MFDHSAYEMSSVGSFAKETLTIWVYGGEGNIPHFHFVNKEKGIHGCVRIDAPEYFTHGGATSTLNSKQKKALVEYLSSPYDGDLGFPIWKAVLLLWNSNNSSDERLPLSTPMPDYSKLP